MPIVSIKLARGRTLEQKRALVRAVTEAVVSTIDVKPEWVTPLVEISTYSRQNSAFKTLSPFSLQPVKKS